MKHSSCQSGNKSSEGLKPKSFRPKRRHSFFAFLLAAVLFVGLLPTVSLPITAASPAADFEFDETTGTITEYIGSETDVVIPEIINGIIVTGIGNNAFSGCSSLTSIDIPASVKKIYSLAFKGCSSLSEIRVAENNPAYCSVDGVLFSKDQKIICSYPAGRSEKSYTIPDSVESIDHYAFSGCSALTHLIIPDSVIGIGLRAFSDCSSLVDMVIPNSVMIIYDYVFSGCSSLENVTISDGMTEIPDFFFSGCSSLTGVTIPDGVTRIGHGAFNNCFSLKSVLIPDGVTELGSLVFQGCSSLTNVIIPDSVTVIENDAFYDCSSLTGISIPDGVTELKMSTFWGCSSLTSIVIPDSVVKIGDSVFQNCSSLASITIPDRVSELGNDSFWGCSSLTSVTIPASMAEIGAFAFWGCASLTDFNLRDSSGNIVLPLSVLGDKEMDFKILYSGTEEEWKSSCMQNIQSDTLRKYFTRKVVFVPSEAFIWGDVDGNGKVESKDKVLISRYLAKWMMNGGFNQAAADFNKNGDVTSAEAVVLARYLAKWTNLPYPVGQKMVNSINLVKKRDEKRMVQYEKIC